MTNITEILAAHASWLKGEGGTRANLYGAILTGANLRGANLRRAILTDANLRGAILTDANLRGANLTDAILVRANLVRANLEGAILEGAILRGAIMEGAKLEGATLPLFQIPQEGTLTVWKKLKGGALAKLQIPGEARRTATPIGRKCRAEFALVLEGEGVSQHDGATRYVAGEIVRPDAYCDDIRVECAAGIHFFLTREEAEAY